MNLVLTSLMQRVVGEVSGADAWKAVVDGISGAFDRSAHANEKMLIVIASVGVIVMNVVLARWITRRWSFNPHHEAQHKAQHKP